MRPLLVTTVTGTSTAVGEERGLQTKVGSGCLSSDDGWAFAVSFEAAACSCHETRFKRLKPATLLKLTLLHGCFSRFLNCTNANKSRNAPHIYGNNILETLYFKTIIVSHSAKTFSSQIRKRIGSEKRSLGTELIILKIRKFLYFVETSTSYKGHIAFMKLDSDEHGSVSERQYVTRLIKYMNDALSVVFVLCSLVVGFFIGRDHCWKSFERLTLAASDQSKVI